MYILTGNELSLDTEDKKNDFIKMIKSNFRDENIVEISLKDKTFPKNKSYILLYPEHYLHPNKQVRLIKELSKHIEREKSLYILTNSYYIGTAAEIFLKRENETLSYLIVEDYDNYILKYCRADEFYDSMLNVMSYLENLRERKHIEELQIHK